MRQPRRGAPLGWLLALLLPLLVSGGAGSALGALGALGGAGAGGVTGAGAPSRQPTATHSSGDHRRLSRPVSDSGRGVLVTALTALGIGLGGGNGAPSAAPPADPWHPSEPSGTISRPAGDDDSRSLAALLVRPGRAPPASTAS
ncbi:hypothetical protein [Streptosporangium sp. NPDC023615]|uniref:hypothetical protein n=1 Tax=Streptosporangium sp. NPDC023615 TaxID=3154794 RepID=UPI00342DF584